MDDGIKGCLLGTLAWVGIFVTVVAVLANIGLGWVGVLPGLLGLFYILTFVPEFLFGRDKDNDDA